MAASIEVLGDLHTKVAEALSDVIENGTVLGVDKESGEPIKGTASAAYFAVAVTLLKNNGITAPSDNAGLKSLREKLDAKRKAAKGGATLNSRDMVGAIEALERDLGQPFIQ